MQNGSKDVDSRRIAVNSVIKCSFCIIFAVFLYFKAILSFLEVACQYVISSNFALYHLWQLTLWCQFSSSLTVTCGHNYPVSTADVNDDNVKFCNAVIFAWSAREREWCIAPQNEGLWMQKHVTVYSVLRKQPAVCTVYVPLSIEQWSLASQPT